MTVFDDVFTDDVGRRQESTQLLPTVVDAGEVEARYQALNDRRAAADRAAIARRNAATARAVAQGFSEYARAFRKVAATKGSDVDHAVAVFLALTCEQQVDEYAALQASCLETADREGSV